MQNLYYITKLARPTQLRTAIPGMYRTLAIVDSLSSTYRNITARKLRTKIAGRIALLCLSSEGHNSTAQENFDVPEEVEVVIQELLSSLEDKVFFLVHPLIQPFKC